MKELDQAGAVLLDRHFVYKSGMHGPRYINMDPLLPRTRLVKQVAQELVKPFLGQGVSTIAAPATGAIVLAAFGADYAASIPEAWDVAMLWADKDGDDFAFERAGFVDHLKGKRVLIVEDLLTSGGSVAKVCREAKMHGADVIGASVICNRGGVTAEKLGVPRLEALANVDFEAVDAEVCQLCADGVPIVEDIGHGGTFKAEHPDYPGGYVKLLSS